MRLLLAIAFAARLGAEDYTRGALVGQVCYVLQTNICLSPREVAERPEVSATDVTDFKILVPKVNPTVLGERLARPPVAASVDGYYEVIGPVNATVSLFACGWVTYKQSGQKRQFCATANGVVEKARGKSKATPERSPMRFRDLPGAQPSAAPLPVVFLRMQLMPDSGDGVGPSVDDDQTPAASQDVQPVPMSIRVSAQSGEIREGRAVLLDLDSGTVSESQPVRQGTAVFTIKPGTYGLSVLAEGFEPASRYVSVTGSATRIRAPEGDWTSDFSILLIPRTRPVDIIDAGGDLFANAEAMERFSFDDLTIRMLPLGAIRTVDQLALLAPGVFPAPQTWARIGPGIAPGLGTAGQFSVNGIRSRENNFTVDGSDNNDEDVGVRRQAFTTIFPQSIESLAEFQIITALPDARFGRVIGGFANAVSRSGTNRFHGQGYGFLTDARWNAREYFDESGTGVVPITTTGNLNGVPVRFDVPPARTPWLILRDGFGFQSNPSRGRDSFTRAQYGFVFGGPVVRDKTFFFTSYERVGIHSAREMHFSVPTIRERGIRLSGDRGLTVPSLISPGGIDQPPLLGEDVPVSPTAPDGDALFSLFPFPNHPGGPYGSNTFSEILPADGKGNLFSFRLDHQFVRLRRNHSLTARYNRTDDRTTIAAVGGALFSSVRPFWRTHNVVVIATTPLTPAIGNYFWMSYGRTSGHFLERRDSFLSGTDPKSRGPETKGFVLDVPVLSNQTSPGVSPNYSLEKADLSYFHSFLGEARIAGFSSAGADVHHFPQQRRQQSFQWADVVNWKYGRHNMRYGLEVRQFLLNSSVASNYLRRLDFHGARMAGSSVAFSPLDLAATYVPAADFYRKTFDDRPVELVPLRLRKTQFDLFFHDEFRWKRDLSISFGFRLELNRLPTDLDGRFARTYDPGYVQSTLARNLCRSFDSPTCSALASALGDVFNRDLKTVFGGDRAGNDPRFGFVWDPLRNGSTVLRGGAGIQTGQFPAIVLNESRDSFPTEIPLNIAERAVFEKPVGPYEFLGFKVVQPAAQFKNPYAYHFTLALDRRLIRGMVASVGYVGTVAHKLLRVSTPDGGLHRSYFTSATVVEGNRYPILLAHWAQPGIPVFSDATINRLLFEGTANSNYHSLQVHLRGRIWRGLQLNTAFTYAHAIDDASDFFDTYGTSSLPQNSRQRSERGSSSFDVRARMAAHFVWDFGREGGRWRSNWLLSGIYTLQSGQPFTVNTVYDWNGDGNLTDRLDRTSGLVYGNDRSDRRTVLAIGPGVDPFSLLAQGTGFADGRVGRNTFRGFGLHNLDLALSKRFPIGESSIELRVEGFNIANNPHFGLPERWLESPAFGQATVVVAPARTIQFACKISF